MHTLSTKFPLWPGGNQRTQCGGLVFKPILRTASNQKSTLCFLGITSATISDSTVAHLADSFLGLPDAHGKRLIGLPDANREKAHRQHQHT